MKHADEIREDRRGPRRGDRSAGDGSRAVRRRILLVPGSTRSRSTNVAPLRAALDATDDDVAAVLFEELTDLPAFNPDDDYEPLPPKADPLLRLQLGRLPREATRAHRPFDPDNAAAIHLAESLPPAGGSDGITITDERPYQ